MGKLRHGCSVHGGARVDASAYYADALKDRE